MPGLPFAGGRACAAWEELGEILSRRGKSFGSASIGWEATLETMMLGQGMGGAYSRSGDESLAEEGLVVDDEGCESFSGCSGGAVRGLRNGKGG